MREQIETDVCIIGAGLAGLTTALQLVQRGHDVTVLEARTQAGGRVRTVYTASGTPVELGAQWIGPGMTRMHRLAREYGVPVIRTPHTGADVYDLLGRTRRSRGKLPPFAPHVLVDLLRFTSRIDRFARNLDPRAPWASSTARRHDAMSVDAFIRRHLRTTLGRAFASAFFTEGLAADPAEVSVLDGLWCVRTNGGYAALETTEQDMLIGAQDIPTGMAARLEGRVRFATPARLVRHDAEGVHVESDALTVHAQRCVIAVPPALAGRIRYEPILGSLRDGLTQRLGQGSVVKIVLAYDEPFWREEGLSGGVYADQSPVGATMDVTPHGGPGILVAFISGRHARRWGACSPSERRTAVLQQLSSYFGAHAAVPDAYVEQDWAADEWARGGYGGHFAPGVLSEYGPALWASIGRLHWAGAETASEWHLYMEGAVQSGERAAQEVLAAFERHELQHVPTKPITA